jgi:predicted transcriptional regulator
VTRLVEWDTMVFLYRHGASLGTASQIARLIGYDKAEIGTALQSLESSGLVRRSRVSKGSRFYQFTVPPDVPRQACLRDLLSLADTRAGRLLLLKHVMHSSLESQLSGDRGLRLA